MLKNDIKQNSANILILVSLSIVFLALNSLFCKLALNSEQIDPYSFTLFRLLFATIMLLIIFAIKHKKIVLFKNSNWISSLMLFIYAITFSYAYMDIDAGFGALLLFGVVQIVMVVIALFYKEKFSIIKLLGLIISLIGLIYLVYPKNEFEISLTHSFLMIIAGIAWALYTIIGKKSTNALENTNDNFLKATIFIVLCYFFIENKNIFFTYEGLFLAGVSGGITSAIGYMIWYSVLPKLEIMSAGIIQIFVPVVAIGLSVLFLDELLSFELIFSTVLIMIGILLTLFSKQLTKSLYG